MFSKKIIIDQTRRLLDSVGLTCHPEQKIYTLNTYEKLLVCIIKAYTYGKKLLVMDYHANMLGYEEVNKLNIIIHKFKEEDISFLILCEKPSEIISVTDRVTIIKDGIDKKVIRSNDIKDKHSLYYYMHGIDFNFKISKEVSLYDNSFCIMTKAKKINYYSGIVGFFDPSWDSRQNAIEYIQDFLRMNEFKFMKNNQVIEMGAQFFQELYRNNIVFIKEDNYNNIFDNLSIKANLVIQPRMKRLFKIINKRIERYCEKEFKQRFYISDDIQDIPELTKIQKRILTIYR